MYRVDASYSMSCGRALRDSNAPHQDNSTIRQSSATMHARSGATMSMCVAAHVQQPIFSVSSCSPTSLPTSIRHPSGRRKRGLARLRQTAATLQMPVPSLAEWHRGALVVSPVQSSCLEQPARCISSEWWKDLRFSCPKVLVQPTGSGSYVGLTLCLFCICLRQLSFRGKTLPPLK